MPPMISIAAVTKRYKSGLVALHAVDLAKHDLLLLGKPEGFLERQVQGWSDRWRRAVTDDQPDIDRAIAYVGQVWQRFVDAVAKAHKQILNKI